MPILRDDDPNIGCLALPISGVGGFVLAALVVAALGAGAATSSVAGAIGAAVGLLIAFVVLRRR